MRAVFLFVPALLCNMKLARILFKNIHNYKDNETRKIIHRFMRMLHSSTQPESRRKFKPLHRSVMVREVLDSVFPQRGDVILDMTFGAGGHTKAILEKCPDCKVIALDRDPFAHNLAHQLAEETGGRVIPLLGRFSELKSLLEENKISAINGAVLDAGCSSMQFDTANRGFGLARDGPLDMRMDGDRFPDLPSAADVVNRLSEKDLVKILDIYGDEKYAKKIAGYIVHYRRLEGPITRTKQLARVVNGAFDVEINRRDALKRKAHTATKTFMAIRIFVNNELNELYTGLKTVEEYMMRGGRLTAITFHSLEDKILKRVITGVSMEKPFGMTLGQQRDFDSMEDDSIKKKKWMVLKHKVVLPQFDEVEDNARSRSAKLRAVTRL